MLIHFGLLGQGLRFAGGIAKCLCCVVCCFTCGGPIMLIAGIVFIATPNNRSQGVDTFNAAARDYGDGLSILRPLLPSTGTYESTASGAYGGNFTFKMNSAAPVMPTGNLEGVNSARTRSLYFAIPFPRPSGEYTPPTSSSTLTLRLQMNRVSSSGNTAGPNTTTSIIDSVDSLGTITTTMFCSLRKRGCSASSMGSKCESEYGSSAIYEGSGCSDAGACGQCRYSNYLTRYCVVIDTEGLAEGKAGVDGTGALDANTYAHHKSVKGCVYPFSQPEEYSSSYLNTVTIAVMASTDPFLVLQRVTEGTMDFGNTAAEQRATGFQLISMGVVCLVMCAVMSFVLYRTITRHRDQNPHAYGLSAGMYTLPGGGGVEMGGMGQPHQVYMPQHPHQQQYNGFVSDQTHSHSQSPYGGGGGVVTGHPMSYAAPNAGCNGGYSPMHHSQPYGGMPSLPPPPPLNASHGPAMGAGADAYIPPSQTSYAVGGAYSVPRGAATAQFDDVNKNL